MHGTTPANRSLSQPNLSSSETNNVTNRKRKPNPEMQDLLTLKQEIGEMLGGIKLTQETQTKKLQESIDELHAQNKEIIKTNSSIEKILMHTTTLYNDLKLKVDHLESGHDEALLKISALEEQVEDMQRNQRVTTLEIRNVPEIENENLEEVVNKIHTFLEVPVSTGCIKQIRRIKTSKNKVIIVEYPNIKTSTLVLKTLKEYNNSHKDDKFNSKCLNLPGETTSIFIAESLTPAARKLHFLARGLRKDHGYQHCWTSMGRVFVKYADGTPAIQIKSIQQVETLKEPPATSSSSKHLKHTPLAGGTSSSQPEDATMTSPRARM
jgi:hypothetical protein